ncbi:esterase-like activity of phytase family protein [Erythrobacter sp.]|uniref:esterase-like activity of phytase family protein n=1 Tax=Erythrobacter sp. TaxID=1042 RepID=UPI001425BD7B|nr:esterase-like activity of phytase family protein [Erythrobacter sp.]QIQ87422.1 MAG: esterase-like activity of phytase family protein [Erythrobacter sp.]
MRAKRLIAALGVALMCAPGTFVRTPVAEGLPRHVALERVAGPARTTTPGWSVAGVWHYSSGPNRDFGGYSALLAARDDRLLAFSDRGSRFAFARPDGPSPEPGERPIALQAVAPPLSEDLWDIESATRDPATGTYWLGFENTHAILRYTPGHGFDGMRLLEGEVRWPSNSGAEAMVRLSDGRFVVLPEGGREGLVFAGDPVEVEAGEPFAFRNPAPGFAATDLAQLPGGDLLLLMRNTVFALPPFESLIAIGPPPRAGETWAPRIALRLEGVVPPENYEGIALEPFEDGRVAVWIISDDNLSIMQRTLLAKLVFDPSAAED